jgi:hypothetical protein
VFVVDFPLVCAPPLLAIVTPCSTCDHDVAPDVLVVLVVVVPLPVDGDPVEVPAPAVAVALADVDGVDSDADGAGVPAPPAVPGCDPPAPESVLAVEPDVDDELDVSALATPGDVITITPTPRAAAKTPTRPTLRP